MLTNWFLYLITYRDEEIALFKSFGLIRFERRTIDGPRRALSLILLDSRKTREDMLRPTRSPEYDRGSRRKYNVRELARLHSCHTALTITLNILSKAELSWPAQAVLRPTNPTWQPDESSPAKARPAPARSHGTRQHPGRLIHQMLVACLCPPPALARS
jgi:hypothetical protein